MASSLYDKVWQSHLIEELEDGTSLIYIDRHLIHEVTSPQAFESLKLASRQVRHPELTLAVVDHNVPTTNRSQGISDEESRIQLETLTQNCKATGIPLFDIFDKRQGIVHVIGPEQGFTLPGLTIVCGDSHTSTHGAFGSLAFGIGTTEVEHVLATQTLIQKKAKNFRILVEGQLAPGVTAKDIILTIIGKIGTAGATGYVLEYAGSTIRSLDMEERMTICNMSIEAGAKAGLIAPDDKTLKYIEGKPLAPKGDDFTKACSSFRKLYSDEDYIFDKEIKIDAKEIAPSVTWGTSPEDVATIDSYIPDLNSISDEAKQVAISRSLKYMGLKSGQKISDIAVDKVFIGSCTNGRINDLREVAKVVQNKKVHKDVVAIIVPGSGLVRAQAISEGLDKIFLEAGFEWREAGCSMCLAMNADKLQPQERCASTSNRNFEGRQGFKGRTHLMSPAMAALAAITGKISDIREYI